METKKTEIKTNNFEKQSDAFLFCIKSKNNKNRDELAKYMLSKINPAKKLKLEDVRRQLNNTIYAINKQAVSGKKWKDLEVVETENSITLKTTKTA